MVDFIFKKIFQVSSIINFCQYIIIQHSSLFKNN